MVRQVHRLIQQSIPGKKTKTKTKTSADSNAGTDKVNRYKSETTKTKKKKKKTLLHGHEESFDMKYTALFV